MRNIGKTEEIEEYKRLINQLPKTSEEIRASGELINKMAGANNPFLTPGKHRKCNNAKRPKPRKKKKK